MCKDQKDNLQIMDNTLVRVPGHGVLVRVLVMESWSESWSWSPSQSPWSWSPGQSPWSWSPGQIKPSTKTKTG